MATHLNSGPTEVFRTWYQVKSGLVQYRVLSRQSHVSYPCQRLLHSVCISPMAGMNNDRRCTRSWPSTFAIFQRCLKWWRTWWPGNTSENPKHQTQLSYIRVWQANQRAKHMLGRIQHPCNLKKKNNLGDGSCPLHTYCSVSDCHISLGGSDLSNPSLINWSIRNHMIGWWHNIT